MIISKICTVCKEEKLSDEFHKTNRNSSGFLAQCKICRSHKMAQLYKSSESRRSSVKERGRLQRIYNMRLVSRYKRWKRCHNCGENESACLDLHHIDPSQKDHNPAHLMKHNTEKLKTEIRKCMVLCSNCHRKFHAGVIELPT